MNKKVNVNEAKVLELWSKGYNDKQVRMYLGLSVSTWDRWKKAYKQRTEVSTEVSTEETPTVGRGGVRYKYTDQTKYEEFKKDDVRKVIEEEEKVLGKGYGLNQKASERPVGRLEHAWTFPYDINGNPTTQKPYTYIAPARSKRKGRPDNIPEEHWNQCDILPEEWMPLCQSWKEFLDCYDIPSYKDFAKEHGISKKQVRKVTRQFNASSLF